MSVKNPEYRFKWCPGCGYFGVRRALERALRRRMEKTGQSIESTVVVAGIGCSGNLVHLLEGPQPYGFHCLHGRSLPVAMGIKMSRTDLDVVVVAGDGDFLGIGMEHIAPQAARNLDITAIAMDNAIYGLTKGQSSPTTGLGDITVSTPYGKPERAVDPLRLYLSMGVSFVASAISSRVRELSQMILDAMDHRGFSIVHVRSPCVTYNDTYEQLRGNPEKGIQPLAWDIPENHDPADMDAAQRIVNVVGVPVGVVFRDDRRPTFDQQMAETTRTVEPKAADELIGAHAV